MIADRTARRLTAALAPALLWLACETPPAPRGCRQDADCPAGQGCFATSCMARVVGPYLAGVVLKPPEERVSALTELAAHAFTSPATPLTLSRRVELPGRAESPPNAPFAQLSQGELAIAATIASSIPGAPDHRVTTVAQIESPGPSLPFVLGVPEARLGQPLRIAVTPRAPVDLVLPPVELEAPLAQALQIPLPGAQDLRAVEGLVRNEFDQPVLGYSVRVFRGDTLVSNRALLAEDGRFRVSFPRQASAALAGAPPVLVLSAPGLTARPEVRVPLAEATNDVGTLRLPPHPLPQRFRIPVQAPDASGALTPVVGALVRLETRLPLGTGDAVASFVQEAQSGPDGLVELALIPGGIESAQSYQLSVSSPPFAEAGSLCPRPFSVGPAERGLPTLPTTATVQLPRRPALRGVVLRPDRSPLPGAVVTASRTAVLPGTTGCEALPLADGATTGTDRDGRFVLRLEPGVHRLEMRPPTGEAVPLTVVEDVQVTNEGLSRDFVLPAGRLLEGLILEADGRPCRTCQVDLYAPAGAPAAGRRGEAITGVDGRFRAVVPAP